MPTHQPSRRPHARTPRSRQFSTTPNPERPQLNRMMLLIDTIINESKGKLTQTSVASEIGTTQAAVSEWLSCRRSAPGGEPTLRMLIWAAKQDRGFIKALLSNNHQ